MAGDTAWKVQLDLHSRKSTIVLRMALKVASLILILIGCVLLPIQPSTSSPLENEKLVNISTFIILLFFRYYFLQIFLSVSTDRAE